MPKARIDSEPHFSELAENIILILFSDSLYVCLTVCVLVDWYFPLSESDGQKESM